MFEKTGMLPLPGTAAAFTQTTQEKPLLKLKISKSHLLCCEKLGGLHSECYC